MHSISKNNNPVLIDFPNPRSNVFLMMRYRNTKQHQAIYDSIKSIMSEYSLNLIRADSKQYHDELWRNVKFCMDASLYGIAVFEQIDERDINPNVSLELGYMIGQGKRCLLLKEKRVPALQSDLLGHLYHEFDSYNIEDTIKAEVQHWLRDLGIAKRPDERMIAYVSQGGTCRCAMAKVITQKLLLQNPPDYRLRVESLAYGDPDLAGASFAASRAIRNLFGEDLLSDHRTIKLNRILKEEADLILVMDHSLLKGLPREKTYVLKPYFGLEGDITDPWPDDRDEATADRYAQCAKELKEILEKNIGKIINALRQ